MNKVKIFKRKNEKEKLEGLFFKDKLGTLER